VSWLATQVAILASGLVKLLQPDGSVFQVQTMSYRRVLWNENPKLPDPEQLFRVAEGKWNVMGILALTRSVWLTKTWASGLVKLLHPDGSVFQVFFFTLVTGPRRKVLGP